MTRDELERAVDGILRQDVRGYSDNLGRHLAGLKTALADLADAHAWDVGEMSAIATLAAASVPVPDEQAAAPAKPATRRRTAR